MGLRKCRYAKLRRNKRSHVRQDLSKGPKTISRPQNKNFDIFQQHIIRTASIFGKVCKRLAHTSCHAVVKECLYGSNFRNENVDYGIYYESVAIKTFQEVTGKEVIPNGFFIDKIQNYLGASPDGIVLQENSIIEVKCVPSVMKKNISLVEAARTIKYFFLEYKTKLSLKKTHNYYFQIQGQLHICNKDKCYLIVFVGKDNPIHIEEIQRDDAFWEEKMQPKLHFFFHKCILPEIILKLIQKGFKCREPEEILKAKEAQQCKRK